MSCWAAAGIKNKLFIKVQPLRDKTDISREDTIPSPKKQWRHQQDCAGSQGFAGSLVVLAPNSPLLLCSCFPKGPGRCWDAHAQHTLNTSTFRVVFVFHQKEPVKRCCSSTAWIFTCSVAHEQFLWAIEIFTTLSILYGNLYGLPVCELSQTLLKKIN